jgi:hypothetical protein
MPPPPSSSRASGPASPGVLPFPPRSRPSAETNTAPPAVHIYDYSYVFRELRRIAVIGGVALLLIIVLSFVLR